MCVCVWVSVVLVPSGFCLLGVCGDIYIGEPGDQISCLLY